MKRFDELTEEQQKAAIEKQILNLLQLIGQGWNPDPSDESLTKRIEEASEEAERMRTPWFVHEYVMETCEEDLMIIAANEASYRLYAEPNDPVVVRGIIS